MYLFPTLKMNCLNDMCKKRKITMSKFWSPMAKRATPYVPGEQLNKPNILKLNTNENPYGPSPKVLAAIQKANDDDLRLYPSPTVEHLKEVIANRHGVKANNVFVGNGSDDVLAMAFMAFFDSENTIRFPEITYSFYPVYANLFNIPNEQISLNEDFTIQPEEFYHSEGGVIFPNPNAPTSLYLSIEEVENIVKNNPNSVVIVDEAYIDFATTSAVTLIEKYNNLLVIQTMSMSHSLAGLRVGLAIGNEELIDGLIRIKDSFNPYPIDRLAIAGATASFEDEEYFRDVTNKIIKTREWTTNALDEIGFQVLPSATNFLFVSHPEAYAKEIYEQLREKDILIRYFNTNKIDNYLRISIGTKEDMEKYMEEITLIYKNK